MFEGLCYEHLQAIIRPVYEQYQPLLLLKSQVRSDKYQHYLSGMHSHDWLPPQIYMYWRRYTTRSNCYHWFNQNGDVLIRKFIQSTYETVENAMDQTENITVLFDEFITWFGLKRKEFRLRMENKDTDKKHLDTQAKKRMPQSHGGVANLLKTLTKTMERQGSDIKTIAKVQYAVCMQAGIYIPDEFIEDVAVALDQTKDEYYGA